MGFRISKIKTDADLEVDGVWLDYAEGMRVKVARMGNPRYQETIQKLGKPYRHQIRRGDLPASVVDTIQRRAMAATILLDWENLENDEGHAVPYSEEMAYKYLAEYPDFYRDVQAMAEEAAYFRAQETEDSVKN